MRELNDDDLMPFGKYKGEMMQDVPADYLHWLWIGGMKDRVRTSNVAAYIYNNMEHLKKEHPDAIWD